MVTRPSLVLLFAFAFAFFVLVPALLSQPFPPQPSIHWADVLDLLTPLVLIPLYWLSSPAPAGMPGATRPRRPRPARDEAGPFRPGLLYGLTFFLAFVEGATVPLGLPAAVLIIVGLIVVLRLRILTHNLVGFVFLRHGIALLLLAVWGIYWKGFPELSAVGLLQSATARTPNPARGGP